MKHHSTGRKLGRVRKQRVALLRSLAKSLILHEKIETTETKARELRPFIEKLTSRARIGSVAARRLVDTRLGGSKVATKRLVDSIAPRYKERSGGYTRITKVGTDFAGRSKAIIEFIK